MVTHRDSQGPGLPLLGLHAHWFSLCSEAREAQTLGLQPVLLECVLSCLEYRAGLFLHSSVT